jgi:hypothetical protein
MKTGIFENLKKYGIDITLFELEKNTWEMKDFISLSKLPWFLDFDKDILKEIWMVCPNDVYNAKDKKYNLLVKSKTLLSRLEYYNCKNNYIQKVKDSINIIEVTRNCILKDFEIYNRVERYKKSLY